MNSSLALAAQGEEVAALSHVAAASLDQVEQWTEILRLDLRRDSGYR
jgi:hypothetical protein